MASSEPAISLNEAASSPSSSGVGHRHPLRVVAAGDPSRGARRARRWGRAIRAATARLTTVALTMAITVAAMSARCIASSNAACVATPIASPIGSPGRCPIASAK